MIKNIYAVRDTVAATLIGGLIMESTDAPAIRAFYDALRTPGNLLSEHPADFVMVQLGNINLETGDLREQNVIVIATGNGWLEMQKGLDK
ncbi:MAG: nonstructural protein [Microvirus sp.]|nr:MAG: nonstructural protein [Microvirus sp.]